MKPRLARALIVLAVFGLLAVLAATDTYVTMTSAPPAPPPSAKASAEQSLVSAALAARRLGQDGECWRGCSCNQFRTYVTWALVTPGILYLARRIPLLGRHRCARRRCSTPSCRSPAPCRSSSCASSSTGPSACRCRRWSVLQVPRGAACSCCRAWPPCRSTGCWSGSGTLVQFSREHEANRLAEIELRHSLAVAQLDALKMKLQPHFLFNALNSIACLARVGETDAVVRMVEHLGTLLRLSMETSARQFVTLDEELALVDAYLAIEEVRFGDRLRVVRRIAPRRAPGARAEPDPAAAGRERARARPVAAPRREPAGGGRAARRPLLRIAVRDDGPGLPPAWSLAADAGAGLRNVTERIQGLFPATAGSGWRTARPAGRSRCCRCPLPTPRRRQWPGSVSHGQREDDHRRRRAAGAARAEDAGRAARRLHGGGGVSRTAARRSRGSPS